MSPDGKYGALTHQVASFDRAATQVTLGWMNANALTILDAGKRVVLGTVLLDSLGRGAANPWGLAWSTDGTTLVVAHAGTHEISVIDSPRLLEALLAARPDAPRAYSAAARPGSGASVLTFVAPYEGMPPGLPFLTGARQRVRLPEGDLGPRAVAIAGHTAYVANYFSDTISVINLATSPPKVESINLAAALTVGRTSGLPASGASGSVAQPANPALRTPASSINNSARSRAEVLAAMSVERRGEFYFHDASLCLQGWQSCSVRARGPCVRRCRGAPVLQRGGASDRFEGTS